MAKAKKLPSGNWHIQLYAGYSYVDGKKKLRYESFTAPTKREVERMAAEWNATRHQRPADLTVHDAIDRYIKAKEHVLSPSTIRGYKQAQNRYFDMIDPVKVSRLTTETMQAFVSATASQVSPKTVRNVYGLLISAVKMFRPDAFFAVSMPKLIKQKKTAPSNEDVRQLFKAAKGDMKVCIALAAFGSLRRGEICGLKYSDVNENTVYVHADMVEDANNKFHLKEMPKTAESVRVVVLPPEVISLIGKGRPDEFIIKRTPNAVTHAFTRLRNSQGINICLHDLRHYYAAIGAVLGIPDNYLSAFGGWKANSPVMKEVYQGIMADASAEYSDRMTGHFSGIINDKVIHITRNTTRKERNA